MDDHVDPRVRRTREDVLRAAGQLLLEEGWPAVTHAQVADRAGYAKATLYSHWPQPVDLLREAFAYIGTLPHHEPTGDLRADLIGEMTTFRDVMVDRGFGRALAGLVDRANEAEEIAAIREQVATEGAALTRALLSAHVADEAAVDAATSLLNGALVHRVLVMGRDAEPTFIAAVVDLTMAGLGLGLGPDRGDEAG